MSRAHFEQLVRDLVLLGAQYGVEWLVRPEWPEYPVLGQDSSGEYLVQVGTVDYTRRGARGDRFYKTVMAAMSNKPTRRGVAEDKLLGRPRRHHTLSVCTDLLLDVFRDHSEWGCMTENLHSR